jgi:hypothetical protein
MSDEKLSGLFSLMKEVHLRSTGDCMALEPSFTMFRVRVCVLFCVCCFNDTII